MTNFTAVHITIGRGTYDEDQKPMSDREWGSFINMVMGDLAETMSNLGIPESPIEVHTGEGQYQTIVEESAKVSTYFEGGAPITFDVILTNHLKKTALVYGQDSIALTIGASTLVSPRVIR